MVQVMGLRNPCHQIEAFQKGLLGEVVIKHDDGTLEKKVGIMGTVLESGTIRVGDEIHIELPPKPYEKLERV